MTRIPTLSSIAAAVLFAAAAPAMAASTKADYDVAKKQAEATYKTATASCDNLSGNAKDICVADAKAQRTRTEAMAEADWKNTPKAREDAADTIADADYDAAKQRCDSKTSNEKDVCVAEAKAAMTKAKTDAKLGTKTADARKDAAEDKRDADYKVAMQKCDGFAGAAKDNCQAQAKATYVK